MKQPISSPPTWWSLDLGDGIVAWEICEQIKEEFRRMHTATDRPAEMAVFSSRIERDLHCHVIVYFAPACAHLAARLSAAPCVRPVRASLELLAGDATCWDMLFPMR